MRVQKVFSIIVLISMLLVLLGGGTSIQSATAQVGSTPNEEDGRRLDVDTVGDNTGELPPYQPATKSTAVDDTLGYAPSIMPPQVDGYDFRTFSNPLSPQVSTGVNPGELPISEPENAPAVVDETLGQGSSFTSSQENGTSSQNPPQTLDQSSPNSELNFNLLPGISVLDNFNRANGGLGPNWTVRDGTCNISNNAAVCGSTYGRATFNGASGDSNSAEADVAAVGTSLQYTGLLLNYGAGSTNLFLKVQQQDPAHPGQFSHAACYIGNNTAGFGLGFFTLISPFTAAHMKATRAADTVTLSFTNIDGGAQPSQTYVCTGAPAPEGSGIGINGYNNIATIDNFSLPSQCNSLLYDNGPLITHPGGGFNGADASALQSALFMNTYGFGTQFSLGYRMADDFVVSAPGGWQVDYLTFYAYQTGSYPYPPLSTIAGVYYQIWDGPPNNPASHVIFGDLTTNRMVSTSWSYIYRVLDTDLTNATRPIMVNVVGAGIYLPQGTYWLDWTTDGSLASGPWAPPITILGQTTTGNALQYIDDWAPALDSETITPQGMPFRVQGCQANTLWNQPLSSVNPSPYVDQNFPDYPDSSSYLSDDFIVDKYWNLETIFVPGNGWNGFTTLANASTLTFQIYTNPNGFPAGDPSGGGSPPIWTLTIPINDSHITIYTGYGGMPSNVLLTLPAPLKLSPGQYWLIFYPTMSFSLFGQYGRQPADTNHGYVAKFINPGGGFGFGTAWQDWSVIGPTQRDIAFRLGGRSGLWKQIATAAIPVMDGVVAAYNGRLWSITGYGSTGVSYYAPTTDNWITVPASVPPFGTNYARSGCQIGNRVFIYGDAATVGFTGLWSYNMDTNAWAQLTPSGTPPAYTGIWAPGWVADTATSRCYMTGGATIPGSGDLKTVFVYNAIANQWLPQLPNFNTERDFHGAYLFTRPSDTHKLLCVAGGNATPGIGLTSTQCYDFNTSSWHAENADLGALPLDLWGMGYAQTPAVNGVRLWMVNGVNSILGIYDGTWVYSVAANVWGNTGSLQSGVFYRTSASTLNGTVYHVGGATGGFSVSGLSDKYVGFRFSLPLILK